VTSPYDLQIAAWPEGTPEGAAEQVAETRQCGRCGGVGTHYLTCPALRLPKGYRINDRINGRISDPDRRPR
jgi:hypothetical protein